MTSERVRAWLADAAWAAAALAFALLGTGPAAAHQATAPRRPDAVAYALVTVAALALVARRRPATGLAVNGAAVVGYLLAGYPYGPILFTVPLLINAAAARWPLRRAMPAAGGYTGLLVAAALVKEWRETGSSPSAESGFALGWCAVAAGAFAVGAAWRVRRDSVGRVRAERLRRAVSEERLRMAQDLHDTIGHGLAVISMQAGVALYVLDRDPAAARVSMEAVRATSRESLESLRAALDSLRAGGTDGEAGDGDERGGCAPAERRPAPGIRDLDRLVDRVRAAGVAVVLDIEPGLPPVPSTVEAVAYRIAQESLTNVLRHVGESTVKIRLRVERGDLVLDVVDSGPTGGASGAGPAGRAGAGSTAGSGIRGMRAQAEDLGGTLRAGPLTDGDATAWAVTARLPLPDGTPGADRDGGVGRGGAVAGPRPPGEGPSGAVLAAGSEDPV